MGARVQAIRGFLSSDGFATGSRWRRREVLGEISI